MKVKRKATENNPSIICFPRSQMVDTIDPSATLEIDSSLNHFLSDYNVWVHLWELSICGAIIASQKFRERFSDRFEELNSLTRKYLQRENKFVSPTHNMFLLLGYNIGDLKNILGDTGKLISWVQEIEESVNFFSDKIDQVMVTYIKPFEYNIGLPKRSRNASFWQYAQYALAEATYDLYTNGPHHIKVYFTIRQEALIDAHKVNKDKARNINAHIIELTYSQYDLKEMYATYIKNKEDRYLFDSSVKDTQPSKAFIGYDTMEHGYVTNESETVFEYIYRHSLKRPYDIMAICKRMMVFRSAVIGFQFIKVIET